LVAELDKLALSLSFYGRRQGGSDARNSCLLRSIDGSGSKDSDMVICREQRDQSQQHSRNNRDPALTVE